MAGLILVAVLFNGILSGLSLDKVIVQLPARRRIGVVTYAHYARAADLGNGVVLYAVAGIGAAVVTIVAAALALVRDVAPDPRILLVLAAVLSVLHSAATAVAAPTMFRVGRSPDTEVALALLLSRFARASAIRAGIQVATFILVALAATIG